MGISRYIQQMIEQPASVLHIFEKANELKSIHGADRVYDFSIGNPDLDPPEGFSRILEQNASTRKANKHGYTPSAGYPDVRGKLAEKISAASGVAVTGKEVIMTCGAAGALNATLRTLLNPGDEVILIAPDFLEYKYYIENHAGKAVVVSAAPDFSIDPDSVASAITGRTAAVIINSPNNPTGKIYDRKNLQALAEVLERKSRETGRPVYLLSDEPYKQIAYDGITVPEILDIYKNSIVVSSYSKSLSIPGERIGWAVVHPGAEDAELITTGMAISNRILGFVNAPASMQRVVSLCLNEAADVSVYQKRRDIFHGALTDIGYEVPKPEGAFYLFVKSPGSGDELEFVDALLKENILVVPGSFFDWPGYFRVSFCVGDSTIRNSLPGFQRILREMGSPLN